MGAVLQYDCSVGRPQPVHQRDGILNPEIPQQ